jgi:hypothetical protein
MRLIASCVLIGALTTSASAAPCHQGDVVAESDRDLAVLKGATCLEGSLTIRGEVTSLSALGSLTEIQRDLDVETAKQLRSLRGLDALARVGGSVSIGGPKRGTPKLRDVDGLNALAEIGGSLRISGGYIFIPERSLMAPIDRVSGLRALARVKGDVRLFELGQFRGLNALVEIGGTLQIERSKEAALHGFAKLATIGGSLVLSSNDTLKQIAGLRALKRIDGDLQAGCPSRNARLTEAEVRRAFASVEVKGRTVVALDDRSCP